MKNMRSSVFLKILPLFLDMGHMLSQLNPHDFPCLVLATLPQAGPNPDFAAQVMTVGAMPD